MRYNILRHWTRYNQFSLVSMRDSRSAGLQACHKSRKRLAGLLMSVLFLFGVPLECRRVRYASSLLQDIVTFFSEKDVLETIRISCAGYPTRRTLFQFITRFKNLVSEAVTGRDPEKVVCSKILEKMGLYGYQENESRYRWSTITTNEKLPSDIDDISGILALKKLPNKDHEKELLELLESGVELFDQLLGTHFYFDFYMELSFVQI